MAKHGESGKIQGHLTFSGSKNGPTTCKLCGMAYQPHIEQDKRTHEKHHYAFVNGIRWGGNPKWVKTFRRMLMSKEVAIGILKADVSQAAHVSRVEKLLAFVNQELKAPSSSNAWKDSSLGAIPGAAFVAIADGLAVGLCVTEPILDPSLQCRWMVFRTNEIVPKQINKEILLGVSRIWVAPKWRRTGLGQRLLEAVCGYSVHGITLKPRQVAFSQPSSAGSRLAKQFNGVQHKSGEVLLPVYIED